MRLSQLARAGFGDRYRTGGKASPLPGSSGQWWSQLGPRSNIDYETEVGNPMTNSIVAACFGWLVDNWGQSADVIFRKGADGKEETETEHKLLDLLKSPNGVYGGDLFRDGILQDLKFDGTAFAHVEFDKFNLPTALWWLPSDCMRAEYNPTAGEWIRYWEYTTGGKTMRFAPEEVIVWREGIDKSTGGRLGYARFKSAVAEAFGDNEARNTVNTIMRNRAQMGQVVAPDGRFFGELIKAGGKPQEIWNKQTSQEMEAKIDAKYAADGRGRTNIFSVPVSITEFGSVLEHLDRQKISSLPETRIPGIFGVHPVVVHLLIGLMSSSDKNNIQYANKMSWQNGIIPLQNRYATPINEFLLPLTDLNAKVLRFGFDRNNVEALQEDSTEKSTRVTTQWEKGGLTHGEYRTELGKPVDPELKDLYYWEIQQAVAEEAAGTADAKKALIARKWRRGDV